MQILYGEDRKKSNENEEKAEKRMKTLKRILKILLVIVIVAVAGYFIYTGCNVWDGKHRHKYSGRKSSATGI